MFPTYRAGQVNWLYNATTNLRYYYDPASDQFVCENGARVPRPPNIRRESLMSPSANAGMSSTPRVVGNPAQPSCASQSSGSSSASPRSCYASASSTGSLVGCSSTATSQDSRYSPPSIYGWQGFGQPAEPLVGVSQCGPMSPKNLSRAFVPLSLDSGRRDGSSQNGIHRWSQPTDGGNIINVFDSKSQVMGAFQMEPKEAITDRQLYNKGIEAYRMLRETPNEEEKLYASFKRSKRPKNFFVEGKVFLILWVEPAGESNQSDATGGTAATSVEITKGRFGESVFSKVRRFVVVREGDYHCTALPVMTYGGRGVSKTGVKKSDHAIIYTGKVAPTETGAETPSRGEEGMRPQAIRVDVDSKEDRLDIMSRIDFGKPHTIQHNLKVRSFGKVHRESIRPLIYQFDAVWSRDVGSRAKRKKNSVQNSNHSPKVEERDNPARDIWKDAFESLVTKGYSQEQAYEFLQQRGSETDRREAPQESLEPDVIEKK